MHFSLSSVLAVAGLAFQVSGHGLVTSPVARSPGDATAAVCGKTMVNFYKADNTSYPEALFRANPKGLTDGYDPKKCNLYLCRGYQFADNSANVQSYHPGASVNFTVYIRIPHKGYANVSVVDLATNTVIGTPLLSWPDNYAATNNPPKDQTNFSVKIPDLGMKCMSPGACALQWYWLGQGQTYESCVDFTTPMSMPMIRGRRV